jgi:hypothetical protein
MIPKRLFEDISSPSNVELTFAPARPRINTFLHEDEDGERSSKRDPCAAQVEDRPLLRITPAASAKQPAGGDAIQRLRAARTMARSCAEFRRGAALDCPDLGPMHDLKRARW